MKDSMCSFKALKHPQIIIPPPATSLDNTLYNLIYILFPVKIETCTWAWTPVQRSLTPGKPVRASECKWMRDNALTDF